MRDYSEKRGGRDANVVERKPVAKNRPRRESGGMVMLLGIIACAGVFGAGFAAGWFVKGARTPIQPVIVAPAVKKAEPVAPELPPKTDVPLTFYKTLPAGGKGAMGTGLNPKKPDSSGAQREPQAPVPVAPAAPAAATAVVASENPAQATAAPAKPEAATRYVVQLASYHEKPEALSAQSKLTEKGTAAYLVESRVPDKGTWWRLRVGRRLSKAEAIELAAKFGKGAVVLAE